MCYVNIHKNVCTDLNIQKTYIMCAYILNAAFSLTGPYRGDNINQNHIGYLDYLLLVLVCKHNNSWFTCKPLLQARVVNAVAAGNNNLEINFSIFINPKTYLHQLHLTKN